MQAVRSSGQEAAEDLFFGQVVMNWARYFVIAGAMIMMLLTADDELMLVTGIVPIMGLLAVNFFLHGRYLVEWPANRNLVVAAGVMDVAAIASVVLLWSAFRGLKVRCSCCSIRYWWRTRSCCRLAYRRRALGWCWRPTWARAW